MKPDRIKGTGVVFSGGAKNAPSQETGRISTEKVDENDSRPLSLEEVRGLMWRGVGLFRTRDSLAAAVARLETATVPPPPSSIRDADPWRRFHLITVGGLIARAALRREESRGGHFRQDFPDRDDQHWKIHIVDQKDNS